MDRYKLRRICAVLIVVIIFIVILRCCVLKKDKPDNKDNNSPVSSMGPQLYVDNDITKPLVTEVSTVTTEPEFIGIDSLDFQKVEFNPDDISLIDSEYLKDIVIVGDSISMGYSVYGRLDKNNVLAKGSIGARNVMETEFEYQGYSLGLLDILGRRKPTYIFVSLGLNDINLMDEKKYTGLCAENAEKILEVTPDSKIIFTAITPIAAGNTFSENDKIDRYNEALRKKVFELENDKIFFVNAAQYIKTEGGNSLKTGFSSGDGIHLAPTAYDYLLTYMLLMLEWI